MTHEFFALGLIVNLSIWKLSEAEVFNRIAYQGVYLNDVPKNNVDWYKVLLVQKSLQDYQKEYLLKCRKQGSAATEHVTECSFRSGPPRPIVLSLTRVESEARESGRIALSPIFKSVATWNILSPLNESSRYFNVISNLRGEHPSMPEGFYLTARENLERDRFVTTLLYAPPVKLYEKSRTWPPPSSHAAIVSIARVMNDWRPANNFCTIAEKENGQTVLSNRRPIIGVGGATMMWSRLSNMYLYAASSLAEVAAGEWLEKLNYTARLEARARARLDKKSGDGNDSVHNISSGVQIFDGRHEGCFDRRAKKDTNGSCQFDGKHSIVFHRGKYLLYSRSNLRQRGGRFVQVTASLSDDPTGDWGKYQLLHFLDHSENATASRGIYYEGNLYFAAVNSNPVQPDTLIGFFPVLMDPPAAETKSGFIGMAVSCDGVNFSKLVPALGVYLFTHSRCFDMPVDGFVRDKLGHIFLLVQRYVPGVVRPENVGTHKWGPNMIAQYKLDIEELRKYTTEALSSLPSCASYSP